MPAEFVNSIHVRDPLTDLEFLIEKATEGNTKVIRFSMRAEQYGTLELCLELGDALLLADRLKWMTTIANRTVIPRADECPDF